jgi:alkanesulfonate monooxygenase SsuD/methylene tetrahydromethanopterin reductase-like flavin-dependent oxidoreductase (luciferase family)
MAERQDRFAEFVDLLDRLLTDRVVSYAGRYWSAREARSHPGCVQQPQVPFAIAATGPRSLRVAARHAAVWVTNGDRTHTGPPCPRVPVRRRSPASCGGSRRPASGRAVTRRGATSWC